MQMHVLLESSIGNQKESHAGAQVPAVADDFSTLKAHEMTYSDVQSTEPMSSRESQAQEQGLGAQVADAQAPAAPTSEVQARHVPGVQALGAPCQPSQAVPTQRAYQKLNRKCRLILDSCADFAPRIAQQMGVEIIGFPYILDGTEYIDDIWQSQSPEEFFNKLRSTSCASTAAVSPGRYLQIFEKAAEEGTPALYLGFTGGLSSSIEAARQAAELLKESHPNFELYVLDNLCPSAAAELLALEALNQVDAGLSARELYEWASEARYFIQGYFILDNFDALAKGGRIPPTAAQLGGKLDIKPVLSYDLRGALTLRKLCRGRKKALKEILANFKETYGHDPTLPLGIVNADSPKDADWLEGAVRKIPDCQGLPILHSSISPVLACHVGAGMVGLCFWGTDRRKKISFAEKIAHRIKRGQTAED